MDRPGLDVYRDKPNPVREPKAFPTYETRDAFATFEKRITITVYRLLSVSLPPNCRTLIAELTENKLCTLSVVFGNTDQMIPVRMKRTRLLKTSPSHPATSGGTATRVDKRPVETAGGVFSIFLRIFRKRNIFYPSFTQQNRAYRLITIITIKQLYRPNSKTYVRDRVTLPFVIYEYLLTTAHPTITNLFESDAKIIAYSA